MSRKSGELTPYESNRHFYGSELRRLRLREDMTLENVASQTISSKSQIHRIEQAEMMPPEGMSERLDRIFDTDGHFCRLFQLVLKAHEMYPEHYRRHMAMEARAVLIEAYSGHMVPGLLQTEAYARALLRAGYRKATVEEIQSMVTARLARQELLRPPRSLDYSVILDEAVLRRPIGGPAVMREQLDVLLECVDSPTISVQMLPFEHGEHALLGGSLELMTLDDNTLVAYEESIATGTLIEEHEGVRDRQQKYNRLRSHALSPSKTATFIQSIKEALPA